MRQRQPETPIHHEVGIPEKMDKSTQVYLMGYSQGLMERVCIPSMNDMTKSEKK